MISSKIRFNDEYHDIKGLYIYCNGKFVKAEKLLYKLEGEWVDIMEGNPT